MTPETANVINEKLENAQKENLEELLKIDFGNRNFETEAIFTLFNSLPEMVGSVAQAIQPLLSANFERFSGQNYLWLAASQILRGVDQIPTFKCSQSNDAYQFKLSNFYKNSSTTSRAKKLPLALKDEKQKMFFQGRGIFKAMLFLNCDPDEGMRLLGISDNNTVKLSSLYSDADLVASSWKQVNKRLEEQQNPIAGTQTALVSISHITQLAQAYSQPFGNSTFRF